MNQSLICNEPGYGNSYCTDEVNFPALGSGYVSAIKINYDNVLAGRNGNAKICGEIVNPDNASNTFPLPHTFTNTGSFDIYDKDGVFSQNLVRTADTNILVPNRIIGSASEKCLWSDTNNRCDYYQPEQIHIPGDIIGY
jgi:hypothetical protein